MAPMKCSARRESVDDHEDGDNRDGDYEESYSLTHLAHRWGVSRRRVRQLLQSGDLPFMQVEGQLRVPTAAVRMIEFSEREESP